MPTTYMALLGAVLHFTVMKFPLVQWKFSGIITVGNISMGFNHRIDLNGNFIVIYWIGTRETLHEAMVCTPHTNGFPVDLPSVLFC